MTNKETLSVKEIRKKFAKFPQKLQNEIHKHKKLVLMVTFSGGAALAAQAQQKPGPKNAIKTQHIHVVTDESYNAANTLAVQEERMNKQAVGAQGALQNDIRLKANEIIVKIKREAVPITVWSGTNDKNFDLGQFRGYMYNPTNGADDRDMQIGQTEGSGYEAGSTIGVDNHATGDWCQSVSAGGGDNNGLTGHESFFFTTGAGSADYREARTSMDNYTDYASIGGPNNDLSTDGRTFGAGNTGGALLPLFTVPEAYNSGNPANNGDGFNHYTTFGNGGLPGRVPYTELDNVVQEGDGDNTSTGIVDFYNTYPDKLRVETTYYDPITDTNKNFEAPVAPQITVDASGIISFANEASYDLKIPNTTDTNFAGNYYTPGEYEAYFYPANNVSNDSFEGTKVPLKNLNGFDMNSLNLTSGDYKIAIYERKSNSIDHNNTSDLISFISLGIDNQEIAGFSMYPNPVGEFLNISAESDLDDIKIYDVTGKLIIEANPHGERKITIPMGKLKTGIYIGNFHDKDGRISTKKIIKK